MRSLKTQGAAETAEDLHEKEGQQMACFGTPEINSAAAARRETNPPGTFLQWRTVFTSLTSFCLLYCRSWCSKKDGSTE